MYQIALRLARHTLDPEHSCLKDEAGIICLKLNKQETKTLELLAKNKNMIIKREIIQNTLWGSIEKDFYLARRLDVIITSLRKYLQIDPFRPDRNYTWGWLFIDRIYLILLRPS